MSNGVDTEIGARSPDLRWVRSPGLRPADDVTAVHRRDVARKRDGRWHVAGRPEGFRVPSRRPATYHSPPLPLRDNGRCHGQPPVPSSGSVVRSSAVPAGASPSWTSWTVKFTFFTFVLLTVIVIGSGFADVCTRPGGRLSTTL
jgi:hypothetical protein